jgi:hypothetical protein
VLCCVLCAVCDEAPARRTKTRVLTKLGIEIIFSQIFIKPVFRITIGPSTQFLVTAKKGPSLFKKKKKLKTNTGSQSTEKLRRFFSLENVLKF